MYDLLLIQRTFLFAILFISYATFWSEIMREGVILEILATDLLTTRPRLFPGSMASSESPIESQVLLFPPNGNWK